jgi:DNA-binding SARP family transcriptional activator
MLAHSGVPRLTPLTIRRFRVERWLEAYAQYPVRLVFAPSGSGKTSTLVKYAAESSTYAAYCALPEACEPSDLRCIIAKALELAQTPQTYDELLRALHASPARCIEIMIDDVDHAADATLLDLLHLIEDARENVSLIYAGRSRERIGAQRLVARGVAALCGDRVLAFNSEETRELAERCGVSHNDLDVRRLLENSDGWALAVSESIRTAAADGASLEKAFERWRVQSESFLHDFLAAQLEPYTDADRDAFWEILRGKGTRDRTRLHALQARGLFITEDRGDLRLYRSLQVIAAEAAAEKPPSSVVAPLNVRMFRSFDIRIEDRPIPWVRRRDQQIVKYLLLRPNGRATRAEIAAAFWPDTDRHLATQSVRTACSTIRKAFASIAGYAAVDNYFRTTPDLQIDLDNVVCDVRRFVAHVSDGDSALEKRDLDGAAMHYRAAERLYTGPLLEFETPEPWFAQQAQALHERYVGTLEHLSEIALDSGAVRDALVYAQMASSAAPENADVVKLLQRATRAQQTRAQTIRLSGELPSSGLPAHSVS